MSLAVPAVDFGPFTDVIGFLMELDKLKNVQRRTKLLDNQRQENSAEHSWHFAIAVMSFAPYMKGVNTQRVIQMALIHDIVEIDAGDVMVYDLAAREAIHEQEVKAANRLFGLLPEPQKNHFMSLWQEYETGESQDARFAKMLDRLMPVLMNLHNKGQSWVENDIRLEQVINRNKFIADVYPEFWQYLLPQLEAAQAKGWLK
ncbi:MULTISPECIES: HD domain-containing protein [Photorhabdus]|uniref:HD domain-containing protein n=2 Tax=Photorhabdus TaxID=29487 RepID=A0A5B0X345_9GAMM|nr:MULTISPECIES: HD domain-containing protein [Photorhabdus]KAA1193780.1 HD domain-containing protein [Photorhabdus heterorhabditis]KOY63985.1 hydrolase [Photorhabdus heterorhabditis]MBS9440469.1 HD domain-containing protein [Photorhabdus heterorhabditis]NHB94514.1 HD domain-containing protein [Photorhabdus cinerea]NRN27194.1 HD domain-containing protein [Photorhabdus heterorhabditis subsp. aluminescens]